MIISRNRKLTWIALLVAVGLIIFMIEMLIPRPLPWLKPGLANMSTLAALYLFGLPEALIVAILRVCLGSLFTGTLFNPTFFLSFGGSISATLMMFSLLKLLPQTFSIIGIGIIGAVSHNVTQLALVALLLMHHSGIFYLLPILSISAIVTGIFVALVTHALLSYIHKHLLAL
ncbi:Gx transporter family protein [candidate division KSB1 bacterium]|nr:Gx transporter family protein [candidate division KSB1 bacterium]